MEQNQLLQLQLQEACASWQAAEAALRAVQYDHAGACIDPSPISTATAAGRVTAVRGDCCGSSVGVPVSMQALREENEALTHRLIERSVEVAHIKEREESARHEVLLLQDLNAELTEVRAVPRGAAVVVMPMQPARGGSVHDCLSVDVVFCRVAPAGGS